MKRSSRAASRALERCLSTTARASIAPRALSSAKREPPSSHFCHLHYLLTYEVGLRRNYECDLELIGTHETLGPLVVKIDVDCIEHKVVSGARLTFTNPASKSASIEFNTKLERHRDVIDFMSGLGYRLSSEQAARAVRTKDPYKGIGKHIFVR